MIQGIQRFISEGNGSSTSNRRPVWSTNEKIEVPSTHQSTRASHFIFMPVNSPAAPDVPTIPTPTIPKEKPDTDRPTRTVPAPSRREHDPDADPGGVPCPPSECPHPR